MENNSQLVNSIFLVSQLNRNVMLIFFITNLIFSEVDESWLDKPHWTLTNMYIYPIKSCAAFEVNIVIGREEILLVKNIRVLLCVASTMQILVTEARLRIS